MAIKAPKLLRLSERATDLLEKSAGENRSASEYVEHLLAQRWEHWTTALRLLKVAGWKNAELLAACSMLNGRTFVLGNAGAAMERELAGADLRPDDIPARVWAKRIVLLQNEQLATGLAILVCEYWAGNAALRAQLAAAD